jgi:hypothetical protein
MRQRNEKRHAAIQIALLFCVCWALGCEQKPRPVSSSPQEAYLAFARAVRSGDLDTAWQSLSEPTRNQLTAKSKEISRQSQGLIQDSPARMFFQSGIKPTLSLGEVKVIEETAALAKIQIAGVENTSQLLLMVKEGNKWAIDLTEATK